MWRLRRFDPTPVVVTDPDLVRKGRNRIVAEAWKVYYDKDGKEIKRVKANTAPMLRAGRMFCNRP